MAEKLDALDLIINSLREHEHRLDEAVNRVSESAALIREAGMELVATLSKAEPNFGIIPMKAASKPSPDSRLSAKRGEALSNQGEEEDEGKPESEALIIRLRTQDVEEEKVILREVLNLLAMHEILSISDFRRMISISKTKDFLSGFLEALFALGILIRRGSKTHKIYMLTEKGLKLSTR